MILFSRNPIFNAGIPKMRGLKSHFYLVLDFSGCNFRIFVATLNCAHDIGLDVMTCSFPSLLYLSCDLSFTFLTFFSILLFPFQHSWLQLFWISVATRKFLGLPKQSNSQQFKFIQIQSSNCNSIHLHDANIQQIHPLCITFKI